jgi:hypothetical protein
MKLTLNNLDDIDVKFMRHCAETCDYASEMELLELIHPYPKYSGSAIETLLEKREWGRQAFGYGDHGLPFIESYSALSKEACTRLVDAGLFERQRYGVSYKYAITSKGMRLIDA